VVTPFLTAGDFNLTPVFGAAVQFRPTVGRLRLELSGDTGGTDPRLLDLGDEACKSNSLVSCVGTAEVRFAGTNISAMSGGPLSLPMLPVVGEPGIVLGDRANGDLVEVIWPGAAGEPPGPTILRIQLGQWDANVFAGTALDVDFVFRATDTTGAVTTWTAKATNVIVPVAR
jgi:hypothetical protein